MQKTGNSGLQMDLKKAKLYPSTKEQEKGISKISQYRLCYQQLCIVGLFVAYKVYVIDWAMRCVT